ncbi:NUDIX domain-containing protein [Micromonospora echinofusca]|uniref:NUDIX domain-containing protein n=1 Tax=Micromonospora echinofusca TaxID=47858 RepID=A0ABS3VQB0_MICEH|nr:NUDIX domain-containing protein [Micromonospora echinofusca]MBO4206731.1 NUDIX domain-containing protein [Micromonospora echinofusca]
MTSTVAALVTDPDGRILLTPGRSAGPGLPAVALRPGETPRAAAGRAVALGAAGLVPRVGGPLVLDWAAGSAYHVFEAGEAGASAVRRITAGGTAGFVDLAELPTETDPVEVRRIAAALAARAGESTVYLEDGRPPPVLAMMRRYRIAPRLHGGAAWRWHTGPVPADLPVRHAWVWLFVPDGRVVVYVDVHGTAGLPGGTLETVDHGDPVAAAVREVREETQIEMTPPVHLGYLVDAPPGGPTVGRVRLAAVVTRIGRSAPDPATGTVHRRLLVPPRLVAELCGWGPGADGQTRAAVAAARDRGIAEAPGTAPVTEIPPDGSGILTGVRLLRPTDPT